MDDPVAVVAELACGRLPDGEWPNVGGDAVLADLGLDSLALVGLIIDLESTFNILFPAEMLSQEVFRTIGTVSAAVASLQQHERVSPVGGAVSAARDR